MTNLASAFKAEMARMARKELRSYVDALKKTNVAYRSEIAALKKRAASLEREVKRLSKALPKARPLATNESESVLRFSPKGLASHRERLGLSAADAGLLLGASGQSVYNWEAGTSRPHADHLAALGAFRKLGRRAAAERLEELKKG